MLKYSRERTMLVCRECKQGEDPTGTCSKVLQKRKKLQYCIFGFFFGRALERCEEFNKQGNPVHR